VKFIFFVFARDDIRFKKQLNNLSTMNKST